MNTDGSGTDESDEQPGRRNWPDWSASGAKIAFTRARRQAADGEIFAMNADGSGQTNLTNDPSTNDYESTWSPGRRAHRVRAAHPATGLRAGLGHLRDERRRQRADGPYGDPPRTSHRLGRRPGRRSPLSGSGRTREPRSTRWTRTAAGETNLSNNPAFDDGIRPGRRPGRHMASRGSTGSTREICVDERRRQRADEPDQRPGIRRLPPAWSPDGADDRLQPVHRERLRDLRHERRRQRPGRTSPTTRRAGLRAAWSPDGTQITFTRYAGDSRARST